MVVLLSLTLAATAVQAPPPAAPAPPPAPIRTWLITTPAKIDTGAARLVTDYLGGEATAFPDSGAAWRPLTTPADGVVDLNQVFTGQATAFSVVYAFTYLRSPAEDTRDLVVASDDDVVAWLNGQRILLHELARGTDGRDTLHVRLAAGWNTLLLKIMNRQGGFGFGGWLLGEALPATNRRPADARPGNLPVATVTAAALSFAPPLRWSAGTLGARVRFEVTAWGAGAPAQADLSLSARRDTLSRATIDSLVSGAPRVVTSDVDVDRLGRAALSDSGVVLAIAWAGGRVRHTAPVAAGAVLALADGRIELADWHRSEGNGRVLEARVTVPPILAGLDLDMLAAEFGATAHYRVNGAEREWRAGVVGLCDACGLGDTLAIRIERDTTRPWWDPPRIRVRNRTYSDLAWNVRLLPALGDSSRSVAPPDARLWLAALLDPGKVRYRALADSEAARLASAGARFRRDTIHLVGNSHIDAAWLWRYPETWGVVENTWRTELKIQQKFPSATFAASSAQYYRWLDTRAPGLVDSIAAATRRGTWSLVGGWWVEADQNVPGGESLVRQGLYGQRYFQRMFGRRAKIAWTPDSFGYPWSMPQIWLRLGMTAFVTQKIRWNDSTEFPHDAFVWQGLDGSQIFAYNPWGYDHDLDGERLAREMVLDNQRTDSAHHMLVLYGVGDHGGGPTIDMLERRQDLGRLPAFPVLQDDPPEHALAAIRSARPDTAWPVWRDELYLEYHRGTYTTQAEMKRRNRRGEELLGTTEMLAALDSAPYPRRTLEKAWQQLLFNQFHDLLPGSGIHPIYQDAMLTYDSVWAAATPIRDSAFARLAGGMDTRDDGLPVVVFNPSSWVRSSYVAIPADSAVGALRSLGELRAVDAARRATLARLADDSLRFLAREVPPLGFKVFWIRRGASTRGSLSGNATHLENDLLAVDVDAATGQITRLYDKRDKREALAPGGRGNVLQLFGDRPRAWDAWDIGYTGESWIVDSVRATRAGGDDIAQWIEVEKPWNGTRILQRIVLRRDEPFVTIENTVDWHETRKLLKVAFDWNVTADSATYEIAYGAIGQPTTPRTQAERAKYEHAGHRWADLSDSTFGVSLLNDGKYGWDTRGSRMRLSLLRAPLWPDSAADRGRQVFRYAVYPHAGGWRAALTERRGQEFNQPLLAAREPSHLGPYGRSWSFVAPAAENVYVTAVKRAEDTDAYVLRLVEWHGAATRTTLTFGRRIARVRTANLLEDPSAALPVAADGRNVTVTLRPWEILTLLVEAAR